MEEKKLTRTQAIETIINLLQNGYYIPTCTANDDHSGFGWVCPSVDIANYLKSANDLDSFTFKVVPMNEIAKDFNLNGIHPENYDVCVEFKENTEENPYWEQYLLWTFD